MKQFGEFTEKHNWKCSACERPFVTAYVGETVCYRCKHWRYLVSILGTEAMPRRVPITEVGTPRHGAVLVEDRER